MKGGEKVLMINYNFEKKVENGGLNPLGIDY